MAFDPTARPITEMAHGSRSEDDGTTIWVIRSDDPVFTVDPFNLARYPDYGTLWVAAADGGGPDITDALINSTIASYLSDYNAGLGG